MKITAYATTIDIIILDNGTLNAEISCFIIVKYIIYNIIKLIAIP